MNIFILLVGVLSNAAASIVIKLAISSDNGTPTGLNIWHHLSPTLVLGIALYGLAFLAYLLALKNMPLNIAHPVLTSGAIGVVSLASVYIFKEDFQWITALGLLFIITGVVLITYNLT